MNILSKASLLAFGVIVTGCTAIQTLTHGTESPREMYLAGLTRGQLRTSTMVARWMNAGNPAVHDSIFIELPFSETGFFPATDPQARFYRFDGKTGQVISVQARSFSKENGRLFVDLFWRRDGQWKRSVTRDTVDAISAELKRNEQMLVRIQPELLVNMSYTISVSGGGALLIPVKGAMNKDIRSFYDDNRNIEGKNRKHEGVDIFAKKGTYVIAPTDGVVSRVGTNTLGGKVIWMQDANRASSYYFAHLDSQLVKPGLVVRQGDVLGTVGNTGNARFTPPHLHFGVYVSNATIDPLAFIRTGITPVRGRPDTTFRQTLFRVGQKSVPLHRGASSEFPTKTSLPKDAYVKIIAQNADAWVRVVTADDREGFLERKKLISADKGSRLTLAKSTSLFTTPEKTAVMIARISGPVESLASYRSYRYVKTSAGQYGWIEAGVK